MFIQHALKPLMLIIEDDTSQIAPKYKDDRAVFFHCSGGMISVTKEFYISHMRQILELHGIQGVIT